MYEHTITVDTFSDKRQTCNLCPRARTRKTCVGCGTNLDGWPKIRTRCSTMLFKTAGCVGDQHNTSELITSAAASFLYGTARRATTQQAWNPPHTHMAQQVAAQVRLEL